MSIPHIVDHTEESVLDRLNKLIDGVNGASSAPNPAVTAHSGGTRAAATQLLAGLTPVNPSGAGGDSLQLPAAIAGTVVTLLPVKTGANSTMIYAKNGTTDTINGHSSATGFDIIFSAATPPVVTFACVVNGAWLANVSPD